LEQNKKEFKRNSK